MSRYTILLNKPYVGKNEKDDPYYFMGIRTKSDNFMVIVGHLESVIGTDNFFFKIDAEFGGDMNQFFFDTSLLNLYTMKNNINIKISEGFEQNFLFEYFSQKNKPYKTVRVDTKWRDDLGDATRFFKINYQNIMPESAHDAFLLALSGCVDDIEKYGKEFLRM